MTSRQVGRIDVQFGRRIPPKETGVVAYWGARALFVPSKKHVFEILPDRITVQCVDKFPVEYRSSPTSHLSKALKTWAEQRGFDKIREACRSMGSDESEEFRIDDNRFHAVASPQCSGGYLYIGIWETKI